MGASGWTYVTPYRGSVEATLAALHQEVFQERYGDGRLFASPAELYADEEFMGEEGTHSILDIRYVVSSAEPPVTDGDYFTLRPVRPERVVNHLGTARPTVEQFRAEEARYRESLSTRRFGEREPDTLFDEPRRRWNGLHVLLHTDGEVSHLGIFGSSGD
ncbi:hypothetical protein [Kitasatospora sp. NPDC089509]|uniref:hypothetical protein n=1 Tax=Kitasatospora sp. NPDC089509 TaxID=3364079 RepID=UPI0038291E36